MKVISGEAALKISADSYFQGQLDAIESLADIAEALSPINGPQLTAWVTTFLAEGRKFVISDKSDPSLQSKLDEIAKQVATPVTE